MFKKSVLTQPPATPTLEEELTAAEYLLDFSGLTDMSTFLTATLLLQLYWADPFQSLLTEEISKLTEQVFSAIVEPVYLWPFF